MRLGFRIHSILLAFALLLMAAPGVMAMSDHHGHSSAQHDMADNGAMQHRSPEGDARHDETHHEKAAHHDGGCQMNLMEDCCVMTCCSATMPDIMPVVARHDIIAALSSRPAEPPGRIVGPLLHPPKPVS